MPPSQSVPGASELRLAVEYLPIDALVPYAGNSRAHSKEQIAAIAGSIRRFGFVNPVLVDAEGAIVAGHARLQAARQAGVGTVPVLRLGHLSDAQRRAYVIADNRLAEMATWDAGVLRAEVDQLLTEGISIEALGFTEGSLRAIIGSLGGAGGNTDPDDSPAAPTIPVSGLGDLWLLGPHRVLCGDSVAPGVVELAMGGPDRLADMAWTDPPYNVAYNKGSLGTRAKSKDIANDALGADFAPFLTAACAALLSVTKGACYVAMADRELGTLRTAWEAAGGHWSAFIVWAKNSFTAGFADYRPQHEIMLYGWKAKAKHYWCGSRDQGTVWNMDRTQANSLHPTMKPVALIERAIENSSKTDDVVLDIFGGSGSTLIAAHRLNRRAVLIEIDPCYVDVIIRRWQEHSGQEATLADDGRTFNSVADERRGLTPKAG